MPTVEEDAAWSSMQVCRLGGISLRQLQWWREHKLVQSLSTKENAVRRYAAEEVLMVLLIANLRKRGLTLHAVRSLWRALRKELARRPVASLLHGSFYLVTDATGKHYTFAEEKSAVLTLATRARGAVHVVSVSEEARRLKPAWSLVKAS